MRKLLLLTAIFFSLSLFAEKSNADDPVVIDFFTYKNFPTIIGPLYFSIEACESKIVDIEKDLGYKGIVVVATECKAKVVKEFLSKNAKIGIGSGLRINPPSYGGPAAGRYKDVTKYYPIIVVYKK